MLVRISSKTCELHFIKDSKPNKVCIILVPNWKIQTALYLLSSSSEGIKKQKAPQGYSSKLALLP